MSFNRSGGFDSSRSARSIEGSDESFSCGVDYFTSDHPLIITAIISLSSSLFTIIGGYLRNNPLLHYEVAYVFLGGLVSGLMAGLCCYYFIPPPHIISVDNLLSETNPKSKLFTLLAYVIKVLAVLIAVPVGITLVHCEVSLSGALVDEITGSAVILPCMALFYGIIYSKCYLPRVHSYESVVSNSLEESLNIANSTSKEKYQTYLDQDSFQGISESPQQPRGILKHISIDDANNRA